MKNCLHEELDKLIDIAEIAKPRVMVTHDCSDKCA